MVSAIVFVILGIYVKMRGRVETPCCEYRHSAGDGCCHGQSGILHEKT